MSQARQALLVAQWEFRRYFKWKDQVLGLMIFIVMGAIGYAASRLATGGRDPVTVATAGVDLETPTNGRLRLMPAPADSGARAQLLNEGGAQGILTRRQDGSFSLLVEKDPRYLPELRALLADLVLNERLADSGISGAELQRVLSPPVLDVQFTDPERGRSSTAEKIAAGVFQGLVLLAIFTSMAYMLTGITGEKQLRVTESITVIIPPQAWIDGKMLGIGAYALATIANMVVGGALLAFVAKLAWGFSLPAVLVRPSVMLVLIVYSILGLLLWNAFFGAFASTIDDPNTSTRTSVMFLPLIPVAMTLSVMRDPDHLSSRVLSLLPITSPSAMPVRVIMSGASWLEIAASLALLIATIWFVRLFAGRIFEIGMLMYGKEPTFGEMLRWASSKSDRR